MTLGQNPGFPNPNPNPNLFTQLLAISVLNGAQRNVALLVQKLGYVDSKRTLISDGTAKVRIPFSLLRLIEPKRV